MTLDLYGRLTDHSLWDTAHRRSGDLGGTTGAPEPHDTANDPDEAPGHTL